MTEEEFRAQMSMTNTKPAAPAPVHPAAVLPFKPKTGGFTPVKLPLVVRQSKKDGRFYLAGNISFAVEVDQQMFQRITETGQGLGEFKAGEVIVWPPYDRPKSA